MNLDDKQFDKKINALNDYIGTLAKAPAQKTPEWYAIKQLTIGGSEISTILGINPFKSVKDLIADKAGIGMAFDGNVATRWGNLFEHVTKKYGEIVLQMKKPIMDAGSIQGVIQRQRYSPDGLGVVQLVCEDGTIEYFTVLFEFKAPLRSLPDGKIPKYYIPQIKTGLLNIPLVDTSIFINNCYRKCRLNDLVFNSTYDTVFHDGDAKKKKNGLSNKIPFACGVICFYQTMEDYDKLNEYLGYDCDDDDACVEIPEIDDLMNYNDKYPKDYFKDCDTEILIGTKDHPMDLGAANPEIMDRVLELHDNKRLYAIYYPIIINNEAVNQSEFIQTHNFEREVTQQNPVKLAKLYIERFKSRCEENDWCTVGYLPWKLMLSDIIIEDRDDDWHQTIEPRVKETLSIIDEILQSEDPSEAYQNKFSIRPDLSVEYLTEMASMEMCITTDKKVEDINDD